MINKVLLDELVNNKVLVEFELERLIENSAAKRKGLKIISQKKAKLRKKLTVSSGVLSLISAGAITTSLSPVFSEMYLNILGAIVAVIAGLCSLLVSVYFSEDETITMLSGSNKYLALREKAYRAMIHSSLSDEERFKEFEELQNSYLELDEQYSKYFGMDFDVTKEAWFDSRIPIDHSMHSQLCEAVYMERRRINEAKKHE